MKKNKNVQFNLLRGAGVFAAGFFIITSLALTAPKVIPSLAKQVSQATPTITPTVKIVLSPTFTPTPSPMPVNSVNGSPKPAAAQAQVLNCATVPVWSSALVTYAVGTQVEYGGSIYQCRQAHTSQASWTPPLTPALWQNWGPCSGPTQTPTPPDCSGTAPWSANSVAYSAGSLVVYQTELFKCLQAHTSQSGWNPPETPALWQDLGPCSGKQTIQGAIPPEAANAPLVGPVPDTTLLTLGISLPFHNPVQLKTLLHDLYNPASSQYHHFLSPAEFESQFGSNSSDYNALIQFVKASNLTVVQEFPGHLLVDVNGTAAAIKAVFNINLNYYQRPDRSRFYCPDKVPSVHLATPLSGVSGLNNFNLPANNLAASPANDNPGGTGEAGTYMGFDFRKIYVPNSGLMGEGQVIALAEFDGFNQSDLMAYENATTPPLPNPTVTVVPVDGADGSAGKNQDEVAMDVELVVAMAPKASQIDVYEGILYKVGAAWDSSVADVLNQIAAPPAGTPLANQISCSWFKFGGTAIDQVCQRFAAQGQAFFIGSGDFGAYVTGDNYPTPPLPFSEDEINWMTAVGGTQAIPVNGSNVFCTVETTWNESLTMLGSTLASGGGICPGITIPSYQAGVNMSANNGSTQYRNIPDVAAMAQDIGEIYEKGKFISNGGTSAAAPLWAGYWALLNEQNQQNGQPALGFANPAIYSQAMGSDYNLHFHDIQNISNNNTDGDSAHFMAVTGYDLATGWGSPKLITAPATGCCSTGENWTDYCPSFSRFGPRVGFGALAFSGKMWVIGGQDLAGNDANDIWSSADGATWTEPAIAPFTPRVNFGCATFNPGTGERMWVIGGSDFSHPVGLAEVWSSADGINWTEATANAAFGPQAWAKGVVYNNRIWIVTGKRSGSPSTIDVWSSADGVNWQQEAGVPMEGNEAIGAAMVLNNKIYVTGASDGTLAVQQKQVFSYDGTGWTLLTSTAPFNRRLAYVGLSYCGKLWVIGGRFICIPESGAFCYENDVWYSSDGVTWTVNSQSGQSLPRQSDSQGVVFQNEMWEIAGMRGAYGTNEVWESVCP